MWIFIDYFNQKITKFKYDTRSYLTKNMRSLLNPDESDKLKSVVSVSRRINYYARPDYWVLGTRGIPRRWGGASIFLTPLFDGGGLS